MRYLLAAFVVNLAASMAWAGAPPQAMIEQLTKAIRKHCPEAEFEVIDDAFVAKSGTMLFTLHRRSKTGEVSPQTYQEEGPNYRGFVVHVSLEDGPYMGAAVVPQTLAGPYYRTYFDAAPTEEGRKHYWVNFSYGSRLDKDLRKAIFEAISRTKFEAGAR